MSALSDGQVDRLRDLVDWPDMSGSRYELIEKVAVGGMGSVYRARDNRLDRIVAFKVLTLPDDTGELTTRMTREAKVVAQLEHPGIVPIHDVGRLDDGRIFYAMKFVEGETLQQASVHSESLNDQLRIVQKICEAIEFAHSKGVIHRDLKPSNIMVGQFGEVLVMDWGIAALMHGEPSTQDDTKGNSTGPSDPTHTADGVVMGTPGFMSPEQMAGRTGEINERTDIYGIGAILYFILTQLSPTKPDIELQTQSAGAGWSIIPPRIIDRSIPRQLEAICLKALSENPSDRYASAEVLSADISRYLDGAPVSAYRENIFERSGRWMGRNRFIVVMVIAYIIVRFILFFWRGI